MLFIEFCHQIDPIDSIGGALVGLMPTFIISPSWGMFCGQTEEKIILGYLPPRYSRYVPIYPHVIPAQSLPSSCHKSKKLPITITMRIPDALSVSTDAWCHMSTRALPSAHDLPIERPSPPPSILHAGQRFEYPVLVVLLHFHTSREKWCCPHPSLPE